MIVKSLPWIFLSFLVLFKLYKTFDDLSLCGGHEAYSGFCACVSILWHGVLKLRELLSFPYYVVLSSTI